MMKISVSVEYDVVWIVTIYQRLRSSSRFHPEERDDKLLRNAGTYTPVHTASYPTGL